MQRIWSGAEVTYAQLQKLKADLETEFGLLKTEQADQNDRVQLLKEQVVTEVTKQWEDMRQQLTDSTNNIATAAAARIDASSKDIAEGVKKELEEANTQLNATLTKGLEEVKEEMKKLQEWTLDGLTQEADTRGQNEKLLLDKLLAISKARATTPNTQRQRSSTPAVPPMPTVQPPLGYAPANHQLKIKEPPMFDSKTEALDEFLSKMDMYIHLKRDTFASEQDKIMQAATYLTGKAWDWWKTVMHLVKPPAGGMVVWDTYDDFRRGLEKAYTNLNEREQARQEISMMFQEPKEKIIDYISRLRATDLKARLPLDRLWEHLYGTIYQKVCEYLK